MFLRKYTRTKIRIAAALLKTAALREARPIIVSWRLTNRCNLRCDYCGIWENEAAELSTDRVLSVLDEFADLGTRLVCFTGGEPLLREDIGEIIEYAYGKGIDVSVNTNGVLVPQRIRELSKIARLNISFDGPAEIHDQVRGKGSYGAVQNAVANAHENDIDVCLSAVLSKENVRCVEDTLNEAGRLKCTIAFQPATSLLLDASRENPVTITDEELQKAVQVLIERKRKGDKRIRNSLASLRYFCDMSSVKRTRCSAGRFSCKITADGMLTHCGLMESALSLQDMPVKEAFARLPVVSCERCPCAAMLDLSAIIDGNVRAIGEQLWGLL